MRGPAAHRFHCALRPWWLYRLGGRLTARYLEKALGKPVIDESRPGAGGIVGTQPVVSAAPAAHLLRLQRRRHFDRAVCPKLGYDPVQDLAPVSIVSTIVQAVIVKKALPVATMAELVAYAKANPGKLNFGSSGVGGLTHFSVELFQARTGTSMVHILFKGGAQPTAAVLAGEIDLSFANMTDALPQIEAELVRGLAVTSLNAVPTSPTCPRCMRRSSRTSWWRRGTRSWLRRRRRNRSSARCRRS